MKTKYPHIHPAKFLRYISKVDSHAEIYDDFMWFNQNYELPPEWVRKAMENKLEQLSSK